MSSDRFEVTIRPDPLLRALVCVSGLVLALAGAAIVVLADLSAGWRALLAGGWIIVSAAELWRLTSGYRRVSGMVLDADGAFYVIDAHGVRCPAHIRTGSLATPDVAWFRLHSPACGQACELLLRARTDPGDWHRLQLAWHLGRPFVGHRGAA